MTLPSRNATEILNAIEARVTIARAKDEPCDVVLVREWEYLLAWFEHPDLGRQHWKRNAANFTFKGVPIIPARQEDAEACAPDGNWIGIARHKKPGESCESD